MFSNLFHWKTIVLRHKNPHMIFLNTVTFYMNLPSLNYNSFLGRKKNKEYVKYQAKVINRDLGTEKQI